MTHSDIHLDAMLRHLGAAYYEATQGRATRADVTRALDTVAEHMHEKPSHAPSAPAGHPRKPGDRRPYTHRWARRVEDVMTTSVVTVDRITPYKEIARLLAEHKVSALPVLSMGRHVAGVVSEADLVALQDEAGSHARIGDGSAWRWPHRAARHTNLTAAELMTAPAVTIRVNAPLPSAARMMHTQRLRMLPVVDEEGVLVGVVSRRDLLSVFLRPDEDIADDIRLVLREVFGTDGTDVTIAVRNGIVTVNGPGETLPPVADRLIWGVDGVVDVVSKLGESAA
ncbi:MAG TPA: CBS domain-containing protein [Streptosporangiaceae bacterium]|nr:CBS domain-containing protein [Streptosporangiaceae bacterium]